MSHWHSANPTVFVALASILAPAASGRSEQPTSAPPVQVVVEAPSAEAISETVRIAQRRASGKLIRGEHAKAMAMAEAGLRTADRLPESPEKEALVRGLRQVVVEARLRLQVGGAVLAEQRRAAGPGEPSVVPEGLDRECLRGDARAQKAALERREEFRPELERFFPEHRDYTEVDAARRDEARFLHEADLRRSYKSDEADLLARTGESRRIPTRPYSFPEDWQDRSRRPATADDGLILFKGPAFEDTDGVVRQTVIYDLRALAFPRPQFDFVPYSDLETATRIVADRDALRRGSEIFTGYPDDLAAGIPLLDYFGGTSKWPARFGTGAEEYAELVRIIEAMLREEEARKP